MTAAAARLLALDTDQVRTGGVVGIVVVVVLGLVVASVVTKIVVRLLVLVVVVVVAAVVWTQRSSLEDAAKNCRSDVTFLGVHVALSPSVQDRCRQLHRAGH